MKALTYERIAEVVTRGHVSRDDNHKCVQYTGFARTVFPLEFQPINIYNKNTIVMPGSEVSYILREYNSGTTDVCSVILLYHVSNGSSYQFSHSLCIDLEKAAEIWGMGRYC